MGGENTQSRQCCVELADWCIRTELRQFRNEVKDHYPSCEHVKFIEETFKKNKKPEERSEEEKKPLKSIHEDTESECESDLTQTLIPLPAKRNLGYGCNADANSLQT